MTYGENLSLNLKDGSKMDCKLIAVGALDEKTGMRTVCFEVNGWFRTVDV